MRCITLTTDFGTRDGYVAQLKGVLLRECPDAHVVDVTHDIAPQDVLAASFVLESVLDAFGPGTIHLVVVDPEVGTDRALLIAQIGNALVVGPDSGVLTWPWRLRGGTAYAITQLPDNVSSTFHGRDILAPIAAKLANGASIESLASVVDHMRLLDVFPLASDKCVGEILHIDHYGNCVTNIPASRLARDSRIAIRDIELNTFRTYAEVVTGDALALVGSAGLVEIAIRNGNAARTLELQVGDEVNLR